MTRCWSGRWLYTSRAVRASRVRRGPSTAIRYVAQKGLAMFEPNLQPLRIPAGWLVTWNSFHEEDPAEANLIAFEGGSLFAADHRGAEVAIDMEWSPKNLEHGRFVVSYVKYARYDKREGGVLLGTFATRDRMEMVAELERFMVTLTPPAAGGAT